ncbi:hypothetical protein EHE22_08800 [Ochrobactrum pseudogrignonense]|uniref:Uncharacterized protein n=1 Tax=Brucella pseudogrignonensis TaxID=419475 RepID=A0A7Y3T4F4_9HYPH|nr:hypothetical protein [Brucella pseudogrignonensis]NNV20521.1 hypothetical protein [Brucella pseudogrignonensis]
MSHLAVGNKPGFGPVVAVVRDDSAEWTTIPATDYSRFFLTTEGQNLSYMFGKYHFTNGFTESIYPAGSDVFQGAAYVVTGGSASTATRGLTVMKNTGGTATYWGYCEIFPRFAELGGIIPVFEVKLIDSNDRVKLFDFNGAQGNQQLFSIGTLYNSVIANVSPSSEQVVSIGNNYNKLHTAFAYSGWCGRGTNYTGPQQAYIQNIGGNTYRLLSCQWDLPANNVALPFPNASPTPGQEVVRISGSEVKVARRGLTVDTTNPRGLMINSNKAPMMCIMMDETPIIPAGGTLYRPNRSLVSLHPTMFLDAILRYDGRQYSIPPVDPNVSRSGRECRFFYKIDPNGITFYNEGDYAVGCKYMIYATSTEGNTSGGNQVLRRVFNDVQIKRPGSNDANPSSNEILLDTRLPSVRILSEGWIPIGNFSTGNSQDALFGTHAAIVNFPNPSGMFIFPKVIGNWPDLMAQGYYRSLRPGNVVSWRTSNYCMTTVVEPTRMIIHLSPGAPTDVLANTGWQYTMPDPIGVRYYVFGATQI